MCAMRLARIATDSSRWSFENKEGYIFRIGHKEAKQLRPTSTARAQPDAFGPISASDHAVIVWTIPSAVAN